MQRRQPRVLLISSVNPTIGPGVNAILIYNALKKYGIEVDLMTKYKVKDHPEFLNIFNRYERKQGYISRLFNRIISVVKIPRQKDSYFFFYKKETSPPVPIKKILAKITKDYDIIQVYFWQGLLSYKTIGAIFDKHKCVVRFSCADYSTMTGGCHFPINCDQYKFGCGNCPAIYSSKLKDFTYYNIKFRHNIISKIHPIIDLNTYMMNCYFGRSVLFKNYDRFKFTHSIVNLSLFYPQKRENLRNELGITTDYEYVFFFGCQSLNDQRKGVSELVESLGILYDSLNVNQRNSILIILAGRDSLQIEDIIPFKSKSMGFIPEHELSKVYSVSDLFLSPSINDAGPLMVLQSIACGTPVISYEVGHAIDFVKSRNTGYCAKNFDTKDFAMKILQFMRLSKLDQEEMRKQCRKVAEDNFSEKAYVDNYLKTYYECVN